MPISGKVKQRRVQGESSKPDLVLRKVLAPCTSVVGKGKSSHENMLSQKKGILTCGLTLVLVGGFFNLFWKDILERVTKNVGEKRELELSPSSKAYHIWVENPVPLYIDFYFFNWTNPSDLKHGGYKPRLQEVGPFRFRERVKKIVLKWNGNKTVTYKKLRRWHFEPQGSNGSLDDEITTINVIALTAARSTRYWSRMAKIPLSVMLSTTQTISTTRKVRQFLFEGFADPLIEMASKIPGLSSQVPFDKFGWFYKRNDSSDFDGVFNMETGGNGFDVFGEIKFWNYQNHTSFYEGACGDVEGSAGDFWPPERPKMKDVVLFSPDMCRFINFSFKEEKSFGDVKGYKYVSGSKLFDNGTLDSKNRCFCGGKCYPSGVVNVSSCRFGAPAFVSYPHFYLADPSYRDFVGGMKPEPPKHDMYLILEKVLAIPLEIAVRLQINVLIEPDSGIRMLDGVPRIFFPMIWFDQKVTIPDDARRKIEILLALPTIGSIATFVFYIAGLSFLVFYIFSERFASRSFCASN